MKKLYLFSAIIIIALLTSCSYRTNKEDDTVKIWWYEQEGNTYYNHIMKETINKIISYAKLNDIKIDIQKYSYADLNKL